MKKKIILIFTILLSVFVFIKPSKVYADTKEVYVAKNGSDNYSGQKNYPVKTLKKALQLIDQNDGIIYLKDNIVIDYMAEVSKGNSVTIKSLDDIVTISWVLNKDNVNDNDWGLRAINNSTLTLENIILEGEGEYPKVALVYLDKANLNIKDGTILRNKNSIWFGGGVRATNSKINMTGGKIENNNSAVGGGAISIEGSELKISGGEITNNESVAGAGILATGNSTIDLSGEAKITKNKSSGYGGGIFVMDGILNISDNVLISENSAADKAGGIGTINSKVTINDGTIKDNSVTNLDGGGIWLENSEATITKALIEGNKTATGTKKSVSYRGGGIFAYSNSKITLDGDVVIKNNTAVRGGGIYAYESSLIMKNANIIENTATANGGGIFIASNSEEQESIITGGTIMKNKNTGEDVDLTPDFISDTEFSGGGIYIGENTKVYIYNAVIKNNTTSQQMFLNNRQNDTGLYAGGIALCPNAKGYIYMTDGAAIYNNTSTGGYDILLVPKTSKLPGGSATLHISKNALGGGTYNWLDINNKKVTKQTQDVAQNIIGFNSQLSTEDINNAEIQAKVIISDNITNSIYGAGGIMCNGLLTIGNVDPFAGEVIEEEVTPPPVDDGPIENPQTGGINILIISALLIIGFVVIELNKKSKKKKLYKI